MTKNHLVMIVDDNEELCRMLTVLVHREGYDTLVAHDGYTAMQILDQKMPDLLLLDVCLPVMDGAEVLQRVKNLHNHLPVIIMTAYADVPNAVKAIKQGAYDYIAKPFNHSQLKQLIRNALTIQPEYQLKNQANKPVKNDLSEKMGTSDSVKQIVEDVNCVAHSNFTVVIYGETGAGKELVANAIHQASPRNSGPFVPVDCGAIPESILESELFGYEKGAFTGADRQKQGKFEAAKGGTLFLDEITNLPLVSQAKLLRVIQERTYCRLGSNKPINVDLRLVVASNEKLEANVIAGSFRQDLFYRLSEFSIKIPPLRKRIKDVPYLANRFLTMTNQELNKQVSGFSEAASQALCTYHWPGNVRELRAMIRRAVLLADNIIEREHLCFRNSPESEVVITSEKLETERTFEGLSLKEIVRRNTVVVEQRVLTQVLKITQGNKAKAARMLKIDYKTIHTKLKQFVT